MLAWIATTNLVHSAGRSPGAEVSDTLLLEYQATRREPNNGGTGLEGEPVGEEWIRQRLT